MKQTGLTSINVYLSSVQKTANSHDLWDEDTSSSDGLNASLSTLAEELGLHDDWLLGKMAFPQHLEITLKSDKVVTIKPWIRHN